ncbi:ATP-binding cassette domain-containing protein [Mycolicibacterium baixiangningiae]|uniref:ATP-binding cassette domain-containing protein n=1 Tax=Mycolicibacterium baixiangningiae TaxID=2761578 RepID=UPI0018D176D1|nr:ATP-binding cassette domain-containing protein [Mycolicibacterium baixiangningiae]
MNATMTGSRLSKRFDDGPDVLDGAEVTVTGGCLTLIRGSGGSGRTTLARCLTGVYRPDAGDVILRLGTRGNVELTTADPRTIAWLRAHHIASFDGPLAAAPTLSAQAAVTRAAGCTPAAAVAGLDRLGVAGVAQRPLGRLRVAERHAVALAAALLSERPFLVLDSPDEYAPPDALARWLHDATAAGTAVVVTAAHDSPLESIATAVGELRKGEISWHRR